MERARTLLKDETTQNQQEILKTINPLQIISRVSHLTVAKHKVNKETKSAADVTQSMAQSKMLMQSHQIASENHQQDGKMSYL